MKRLPLLLPAISLLLGAACVPMYVPSAPNIPQVNSQGDLQLGAYMGSNGIDLQGSYALTDHTAIMGALSGPIATNNNHNRHLYLEGGYGIMNKRPQGLRASAFVGVGAGVSSGESVITINGSSYNRSAEGAYWKPFLQGNVGFHNDFIDAGLSSRVALLSFSYADIDGQTPEQPPASLMIEPTTYLALGWKSVKISTFIGLSLATSENIGFEYYPFMFGTGLQFLIDKTDP